MPFRAVRRAGTCLLISALAAGLLLWALCGRTTPLLRLVGLTARAVSRLAGRPVGAGWAATVSELLTGADGLVRRRRVALTLGTIALRFVSSIVMAVIFTLITPKAIQLLRAAGSKAA